MSKICFEVFKLLIHRRSASGLVCGNSNLKCGYGLGAGTVFFAGKVLCVAGLGAGVNVVVLMKSRLGKLLSR